MIYVLWFMFNLALFSPVGYFHGLAHRRREAINWRAFAVSICAIPLAYVTELYGLYHWFWPIVIGPGAAPGAAGALMVLGMMTPALVMEQLVRRNMLLFAPPVETESASIVETAAYRDPAVIVTPRLPSLRHWAYERFPVLFKDAPRVQ